MGSGASVPKEPDFEKTEVVEKAKTKLLRLVEKLNEKAKEARQLRKLFMSPVDMRNYDFKVQMKANSYSFELMARNIAHYKDLTVSQVLYALKNQDEIISKHVKLVEEMGEIEKQIPELKRQFRQEQGISFENYLNRAQSEDIQNTHGNIENAMETNEQRIAERAQANEVNNEVELRAEGKTERKIISVQFPINCKYNTSAKRLKFIRSLNVNPSKKGHNTPNFIKYRIYESNPKKKHFTNIKDGVYLIYEYA